MVCSGKVELPVEGWELLLAWSVAAAVVHVADAVVLMDWDEGVATVDGSPAKKLRHQLKLIFMYMYILGRWSVLVRWSYQLKVGSCC